MTDADAISSFLLHSPGTFCVECMAWKTGLTPARVEAAMMETKRDYRLTISDGNCTRCLRDREVASIS